MNWTVKQLLHSIICGVILPAMLLSLLPEKEGNKGFLKQEKSMSDQQAEQRQIWVVKEDGKQKMDLEEYIVHVILGEVSSGFHEEALKAQAVAARTYTLYCIERNGKHGIGGVCTDYRCCQAYRTPEDYLSAGGKQSGVDKVRRAVSQTAGEVLYYNSELICATYFASSGGLTEDAEEVWGSDYPYLKPVLSPGEEECGYFSKQVVYSGEELQQRLGVKLQGKPQTWFGMITYTTGGGVDLMRIGGKLYTGVELRSLLGLRSTIMTVTTTDDSVIIDTKGYGHRVGMSQHGANAMAESGSDYREILGHYYTDTTVGFL